MFRVGDKIMVDFVRLLFKYINNRLPSVAQSGGQNAVMSFILNVIRRQLWGLSFTPRFFLSTLVKVDFCQGRYLCPFEKWSYAVGFVVLR